MQAQNDIKHWTGKLESGKQEVADAEELAKITEEEFAVCLLRQREINDLPFRARFAELVGTGGEVL